MKSASVVLRSVYMALGREFELLQTMCHFAHEMEKRVTRFAWD